MVPGILALDGVFTGENVVPVDADRDDLSSLRLQEVCQQSRTPDSVSHSQLFILHHVSMIRCMDMSRANDALNQEAV